MKKMFHKAILKHVRGRKIEKRRKKGKRARTLEENVIQEEEVKEKGGQRGRTIEKKREKE